MSLSSSVGNLMTNGGSGGGVTPASSVPGTFAQPRKRPSDVAFDSVVKKVRTRETIDGSRNLEVIPTFIRFYLLIRQLALVLYYFSMNSIRIVSYFTTFHYFVSLTNYGFIYFSSSLNFLICHEFG